MVKRLTTPLVVLTVTAQTAWCDWHDHFHHGSHGGGAPADPRAEAIISDVILILAASAAILFLVGPVLVIRARRIRTTLLAVPLLNLLLYFLSIALRFYPGGFTARFRPPGLWYTMGELLLLFLAILIVAVILAAIQWVVRKVRSARAGRTLNCGLQVNEWPRQQF